MAEMIEATGKAFFMKCKGIAVVVAAVSGLVLGVLNWFKETRDPKAKSGYEEVAKQVESMSEDVKKLSAVAKQQAEQISTVQNWIISEGSRRTAPSPTLNKIEQQVVSVPKLPAPPIRKLKPWEGLREQRATK